jgi:cell division protein FtsZ
MGEFDNIESFESHKARIVVVGAGGAGCNTITRLTEIGISGATTIAVNTDAKHLGITKAHKKILIGKQLTKGLGAGGYPEIGKQAALESKNDLKAVLADTDLVFLTCGLGGGTGTGSLPVIAKIAKEAGAITIAATTLPFKLEGARIAKAEEGLAALRQVCDTVIVIENQKLLKLAGDMPLKSAFGIADDLIAMMIKGITETIAVPSLVNLDYADVRAIMRSGGVAAIGVGQSDSEKDHRAEEAIYRALNHPLLEVDYSGANGALIQVIGGNDMTLEEVSKIGEVVQSQLDPAAQVIWGARILPEFDGKIQVISIITGVKSPYILGPQMRQEPATKSKVSKDLGIDILN